jgi:hypothetical protein
MENDEFLKLGAIYLIWIMTYVITSLFYNFSRKKLIQT